MTPKKNSPFQLKKRIPDSDRVTVMFIKGAKKLRSFSISAPFLFGGLLFFALYVALSILFINLYFSEITAGRSQSRHLIQLEEEMNDTREALEEARGRLRELDARISGEAENSEQAARYGETEAGDWPSVGQEKKWVKQGGSSLDVQRFSARRDHQQLRIHFRLVNIDPDNRSISGYVIMIALNSEKPPRYWTYPRLSLKNGLPVDFEGGEYFKIRNYRTVRGRYVIENDDSPPTSIRILAYNESGLLMMKKEMALDE